MSYGSLSGVSALVPVAGTLGATSTPTSAQVTEWLAQGSARMTVPCLLLATLFPVASTATVHAELTALANLYAAARMC